MAEVMLVIIWLKVSRDNSVWVQLLVPFVAWMFSSWIKFKFPGAL